MYGGVGGVKDGCLELASTQSGDAEAGGVERVPKAERVRDQGEGRRRAEVLPRWPGGDRPGGLGETRPRWVGVGSPGGGAESGRQRSPWRAAGGPPPHLCS